MTENNSNHLAQRRAAILAAAEQVFEEHGFAATTVDAIAAAAGVAKGSIYNYFQSKEDLFQHVFETAIAGGEADVQQVLDEPISATAKLERVIDWWYTQFSYHKKIGRLILECWAAAARDEQQSGKLTATFSRLYDLSRGIIGRILEEAIAKGEIGRQFDVPIAAALIVAILDGVQVESILNMGVNVNDEYLAALKRAMLASLKGVSENGLDANSPA